MPAMRSRTVSAATVVAAMGLAMTTAGCASGDGAADQAATASATPVNTVCPIGGHDVPADAPTATHAGRTIAFCCGACADAFSDMDDADRDDVLATAMGPN